MRRSAALSAPPAGPATASRRPLRADAQRNYERLIGAARSVLAERGSEASMEEIAKRADVGVGTLYRHFPRRIDLVEAVYREDVDSLVTLADSVVVNATPWDALVEWLDGFVRYAQAKRVFLTELHEAFEKNPDLAPQSREKIRVAAGQVLERAQQAGVARDDIDAADLMQLIAGMCMSRDASLERNARLLSLVLDGVRTPARR
jgi:AcrR family transcriptional regulator